MKNVLFMCTQNAGRSQMAQALFERYGPPDLRAESTGAEPECPTRQRAEAPLAGS